VSNTDPRPSSEKGAHTSYGRNPGRSPAKRSRWIWIVLGLVVVGLILFWIYNATTPADTGFAGRGGGRGGGGARGGRGGQGGIPTAVNAAMAVRGNLPIYLDELGTVTPPATVTVIPQISGVLQTVAFKEGQMVKKGQFLAQIDPRPYEQMLAQAEGTLAKDRAALADAKLDLKRYQTLLSQDSINSQQVDTQTATVKQDEGQVKNDEAAVAAQKLNLIYCHITSPVDGRVGLRQVDPGNYVTAGTANGIVVVTVIDPMDVLFTLSEDNLTTVASRIHAGAVLPAVAYDRAQTTKLAEGKLLTLDNQVDTTTGTVRAKARFDNKSGILFPNQFVNIRLTVDTLKNAVIIPTSAVLKGPQGMFVFRVEKTSYVASASVVPVKVGPAAGENTAILSGLDAGDIVITDGSDRLKDGSRVVLPGDCIPGGAGRSRAGGARAGGAGGSGSASRRGGGGGDGGFLGLFAKKPPADPLAAMRCAPGQRPLTALTAPPPTGLTASGEVAPAPTPTGSTAPAAPSGAPTPAAPTPAAHPGFGGGQGRGEGGGGQGGRLQAMIAALGLDAAQQQKVQAIAAEARQTAQNSDDPRAAYQAMNAKIAAILRPDQKIKFDQLRAQAAARRAQAEAGGGSSDQ